MSPRRIVPWVFAVIVLVALPALIHAMYTGSYIIDSNGDGRTFAIGRISTTIPYICLALLFLVHSASIKTRSLYPAYGGTVLAWMCMMAFTGFLVSHPRGPDSSSTLAIAVFMTPFCYIPFLVLPYLIGSAMGRVYARWRGSAIDRV